MGPFYPVVGQAALAAGLTFLLARYLELRLVPFLSADDVQSNASGALGKSGSLQFPGGSAVCGPVP